MTGQAWTQEQIEAAIKQGPHQSSLSNEALEHFTTEAKEKVALKQARIVSWDSNKENPPKELKILPIAAIPHKLNAFCLILDLSFSLWLKDGTTIPSVNNTTVKTGPKGTVDQIGHSLLHIIHAFAETSDDDKIFMAKYDIKDGFWRMNCRKGEEWNFCYVLPQPPGKPIQLVVPTSLQMGWIESPAFFCAAMETGQDVLMQYTDMPFDTLPLHKFKHHADTCPSTATLSGESDKPLQYMTEVYVNNFMSVIIPHSKQELRHTAWATTTGIHDVFPPNNVDENNPISLKKLLKGDSQYSTEKCLLGFDLNGDDKTLWLEDAKRQALLTILHGWLRTTCHTNLGIPFSEFKSIIAKIRHTFTSVPAGRGLLSPCNRLLKNRLHFVYLSTNATLYEAIENIRTLLRESTTGPTCCHKPITAWPDYIGVWDASRHCIGGIIIGKNSECPPTVFRYQWLEEITAALQTQENLGTLPNLDLKMAGLLLLWLVVEKVCPDLMEKTRRAFQQQHPHCQLGHTACVQKIMRSRTPCLGTRPTSQDDAHLPTHTPSHHWLTKRND
jgi:hypothetical protein